MTEWWTYRPTDLLMFAPATYWRLFELHNRATWPAPLLLPLAGLAWLAWFAWRPSAAALRGAALAAALACGFVAGSFLLQRYAPINWAASGFAAGLGVLALLWLVVGGFGGLTVHGAGKRRSIGLLLLLWAALFHPWLSLVFGRPLWQAEVAGLAPDPTVIACMGLLLCLAAARLGWLLGALWALCLLWCAISAASLWTMGSAQAVVPVTAACLAVFGARWRAAPMQR